MSGEFRSVVSCSAGRLRPGAYVTGVWSPARLRWDAGGWRVLEVTPETAPDGTAIVTLRTGPSSWQSVSLCADTVVRVEVSS